eukprot:8258189-Prorocentrum_lima.AAC.1
MVSPLSGGRYMEVQWRACSRSGCCASALTMYPRTSACTWWSVKGAGASMATPPLGPPVPVSAGECA